MALGRYGEERMDFDGFMQAQPEARTKTELPCDQLVPFGYPTYKLRTGKEYADLKESIRTSGIHEPVSVRRLADGKYQIISGHNRVKIAKELGMETVPTYVLDNLEDDFAALTALVDSNSLGRNGTLLSEKISICNSCRTILRKKQKETGGVLDAQVAQFMTRLGESSSPRMVSIYAIISKIASAHSGILDALDNRLVTVRFFDKAARAVPMEQYPCVWDGIAALLADGKKITPAGTDELCKRAESGSLANTPEAALVLSVQLSKKQRKAKMSIEIPNSFTKKEQKRFAAFLEAKVAAQMQELIAEFTQKNEQ